MEENKKIIDHLNLQVQLMEVRGDHPHRVAAWRRAASIVRDLEEPVADRITAGNLTKIDGIGPSIEGVMAEFIERGTTDRLAELKAAIPAEVQQMLDIRGLGPKKVAVIWREMGIDSMGALYYACVENRLSRAKGFGEKTQTKLLKTLEFMRAHQDQFLYAQLHTPAQEILERLQMEFGTQSKISLTGRIRRQMPVLNNIQLLLEPGLYRELMLWLIREPDYELITAGSDLLVAALRDTGIHIEFMFRGIDFYGELFLTTGPEAHTERIPLENGHLYGSEAEIYETARINYVEPVQREGAGEIRIAYRNQLPSIITASEVRGLIHAHSTWSDGRDTLAAMAEAARELGMQYLGITDHSQSAFYANGLSPQRVKEQHAEIDLLNDTTPGFRILKGIEADILANGDLDYDAMTLSTFDFVIASIHSNLNMTEEKATERLLKAIRNPYTNILGHPTGRLLLSRPGYPIDHRTIIDACALYNVAIELNANPQRMDLDWKWIRYAVEREVMISINPDAHRKEALSDYKWGIPVAQKGLLPPSLTLNAMGLDEIEEFFLLKRKRRIA